MWISCAYKDCVKLYIVCAHVHQQTQKDCLHEHYTGSWQDLVKSTMCSLQRLVLLTFLLGAMALPIWDCARRSRHEAKNSWTRLTSASPLWCTGQDNALVLPWTEVITNEASASSVGSSSLLPHSSHPFCPSPSTTSCLSLQMSARRGVSCVFGFCLLSSWIDSVW